MTTRCAPQRTKARSTSLPFLLLLLVLLVAMPRPARAADPLAEPEVAPLYEAARRSPDDLSLRLQLGEALRRLGRIEGRRIAAEQYADALRRWPKDPDLLTAYAQLRVEQGFLSQGAALFRKALKHDGRRVAAEFGLARLALRDYLRYFNPRNLEESWRRLARTLTLEPTHRDALYFRVFVLHEAGEPDSALAAARLLARLHPTDAWGELVLGAMSHQLGRKWEAQWAFEKGVAALPPEEALPFRSLEYLSWRAEETRDELPEAERAGFERDYWKKTDPTPASPENEGLVEHRARIVLAEMLYGIREKRIRGWETAPGEAIIRFGMPVARNYELDGSFSGAGFPLPGLTHLHRVRGRDVVFTFVDRNLSGFWVQPFNNGLPTEMQLLADRYENVVPTPWTGPDLGTRATLAQFRGARGGSRLEVYLAARQLAQSAGQFRHDVAIFDRDWHYLARATDQMSRAEAVRDRRDGGLDWVDYIPFDVTGDSVWVGATVELPDSASGGRYLELIPVKSFPTDRLCLSDLVLLDRVDFDASEGHFVRGGGRAIPNPRRVYRSGESVPVYFEAYNLPPPDSTGTTAYALVLQVEAADPPHRRQTRPALIDLKPPVQPLVRARFDETAIGRDLERLLDVEVGPLAPGRYRMRLTVEADGGRAAAHGQIDFRIVGTPPAASVSARRAGRR